MLLLNADASVRGIKDAGRPIVPEAERAELLAALTCIDYVCIFSDPTPEAFLTAIRPEVHVKGGDYDAQSLPEAEALTAMGTELVFIPTVVGHSTTGIIEKIKQVYC